MIVPAQPATSTCGWSPPPKTPGPYSPPWPASARDLTTAGTVFQIGVVPRRIDILNSVDGVSFEEAWPQRLPARVAGLEVPVIGREHLIRNKRATARPKDLVDAAALERE